MINRLRRIPNLATTRTLYQSRVGKNVRTYRSRKALFRDLGLR